MTNKKEGENMNKKSKKNNKRKNKTKNSEIPEEMLIKFHDTFDRLVSDDYNSESGVRNPRQNFLDSDEDDDDYYDEYDEEYDEYDYDLQPLDEGSNEAQSGDQVRVDNDD